MRRRQLVINVAIDAWVEAGSAVALQGDVKVTCRPVVSRKSRSSLSMVIASLSAGACRPEAALGRLRGMPLYCDMDRVEIMKKTKRKKIVSIIGMISMRAFFMLRR